jgi:hypothetical protein
MGEVTGILAGAAICGGGYSPGPGIVGFTGISGISELYQTGFGLFLMLSYWKRHV